ncbi:MAG: 8-amino-7-oxononanoate synthase [Sediminibacterium sp.]|nr:8-amino-7-oxononanoate synthase [Sediminibacterium sp.]
MYRDDFLNKKLNERKDNHSFRELRLPEGKIDFCSNDYLGIVKNASLHPANGGTVFRLASGSTGSRLLSGNYPLIEEVEKQIAAFHQSEAALLFNSGYDANIGLLSSEPQKGDTILYDQLCHASIRDGIRLSFANAFSFTHNDLDDLQKKIQHAKGTVFIVTESVFSMDGDLCPLAELINIAQQKKAHLIIDEAHATGVIGEQGEGLVQHLQMQDHVFARVHTFGKACGCHGAVVLGSHSLRDYLVNFARSFVFSTSLPEHSVSFIKAGYELFPSMNEERKHLQELIAQFQSASIRFEKLPSVTPIQIVIIPGNEEVKKVAAQLQQQGLDVRAILYPTVPKSKERLRIVLHSFNIFEELDKLITLLRK